MEAAGGERRAGRARWYVIGLGLAAACAPSHAPDAMLVDARAASVRALVAFEHADHVRFCDDEEALSLELAPVVEAGCQPYADHPEDRRAERLCQVAAADADYRRDQVRKACKRAAIAAAWAPPEDLEAELAAAREHHAQIMTLVRARPIACPRFSLGGKPRGGSEVPWPSSEAVRARRLERLQAPPDEAPTEHDAHGVMRVLWEVMDDACNLHRRMREHAGLRALCKDAADALVDTQDALIERCLKDDADAP